MKKRVKKDDKFTVTEVGALIEDLRGQFKVFGEGLIDLREKFDTLAGKVDTLTGIVAREAEKSDLFRMRIVNLENTVTQINGKLARIEEDIRLIRNNLASKVDHKNFEILEKKVASLTR
jgi:uncharacterized phage infection (PIP) family protein YhgE